MNRNVLAAFAAVMAFAPGIAGAGVVDNGSLASPDASGDPGVYFGTGNSNSGFTVSTDNGIELGLSAITRYVGPITPTPTNSNVYDVPTGPTTVPSKTGAAWGFDFSIDLQPGGTGSLVLSDITAQLTLTDVGNGTTGGFDPLAISDNTGWGPSGANAATSNLTIDWGAQNSEALSFASIAAVLGDPGFDLNANDTYDFKLDVYNAAGGLLASDAIVVVAGTGAPVPEPGSLALLCAGLAGLAALSRFKRPSGTPLGA